jgi:hypothetical protein
MNKSDMQKQTDMDESTRSRMREYAWNYFQFHAEQRMKTFDFFLIIAGAIIAGFLTTVHDERLVAAALGFLLGFMSLVFGKLEKRNRELVRNGEAALKYLDELEGLKDDDDGPNRLKLFARDDFTTRQFPKVKNVIKAPFSYTVVLACVFWRLALLGLAAGMICIMNVVLK